MHDLIFAATCTSFLKILQYFCVVSRSISGSLTLTPSRCVHNPERIFRFQERDMGMFQPMIDLDLDSLRAILPVE